MSIESVISRRDVLIQNLGKAALNIKYPNDFEVYMCALELQAEDGTTLEYFIFPVMPSSIDENLPSITNIKKSAAGVIILSTSSFIPTDINLVGTFGKRFRILLGKGYHDLVQGFKDTNGSNLTVRDRLKQAFDLKIKSGYGCIKILQDLVSQLNTIDENGVKKLILYNLALGNNYVVEPIALRFSQSEESNTVWNYALQLKSVMPLDAFLTDKELEKDRLALNLGGLVQDGLQRVMDTVTTLLAEGEDTIVKNLKKKK